MSQARTIVADRTKLAAIILFHSTCAISVTLVSKYALNGIDAPITLLVLQTSVQVLCFALLGMPIGWVKMEKQLAVWGGLVPLASARVAGVVAKTYCLAAVDASLYQIARGLLLPFTVLLSYIFLGKSLSTLPPLAVVGCLGVISGFGVGMVTDMHRMLTSTKGLVLGVGSSLTTAIESIVVKKYLGKKDKDGCGEGISGVIQMAWMSSIIALGLYVPLLFISEEWRNPALRALVIPTASLAEIDVNQLGYQALVVGHIKHIIGAGSKFLQTCLLTGVCSALLTIATYLQISATSPTTHMIVTAARGVAQSLFAVLLLPHESMGPARIWSMACILGGSSLYGWAQDRAAAEQFQGYIAVSHTDVEK